METFAEFLENLPKRLAQLDAKRQMAFSASCCERALPNYLDFSREEGWGDAVSMRRGLDLVWDWVLGREDRKRARALLEDCRKAIPDLDDHPGFLAAAAQEAGFSVLLALEQCLRGNPQESVRIATFSRDTLDLLAQVRMGLEPDDPELESKIEGFEPMIAEVRKQAEDIRELETVDRIEVSFVDEFRKRAQRR